MIFSFVHNKYFPENNDERKEVEEKNKMVKAFESDYNGIL